MGDTERVKMATGFKVHQTILTSCSTCKNPNGKYKCPGCGLISCSLLCVKKHKEENNCSGIRDKTEFIGRENMDNFTVLSDYRFLEEIDHKLEDGMRNPLRHSIVSKTDYSFLPPHLKKLKYEAKLRGTHLEFLPQHFSKHHSNSTRYVYAEKKIRWHIHWKFPQANVSCLDQSVDEDLCMIEVLQKYLEPPGRINYSQSELVSNETLDKLAFYHSATMKNISVLLKIESSSSPEETSFVETFPSKSFKLNLANKRIIEHPVFYVVLRSHLDFYLGEDYSNDIEIYLSEQNNCQEEVTVKHAPILRKALPRIKSKDGGLCFFDAFSDDSSQSDVENQ